MPYAAHRQQHSGEGTRNHAGDLCRSHEHRDCARQHHRHRDDTPRNHDSADPDTRADPPQHEIAGYLEYEIADEEDAGAEAEGGGAQPELAVHLERGETDVDAVEVGDDVEYEEEGNQLPSHAGVRGIFGGEVFVIQSIRTHSTTLTFCR